MMRGRKGFTLIELLMVTVLGSLVVLAAMQVLITNRRTYTAQAATIAGQQTTRMSIEVLFSELREVSASGGDILMMSPDSIRVRLMRKFSYVCDTDLSLLTFELTVAKYVVLPGGDTLRIMSGTNQFSPGDSVFVFADNDENLDTDDTWISAVITAVDPTEVCPDTGDSALVLEFAGQGAIFDILAGGDSVGMGAPVRSYREYTFGTTVMNGDVYLARRDTASFIPIAGPLAPTNGLEFVYRDSLGAVTSNATDVSQIEVTIRTGSEVLNSLGRMVSDSVQVWIFTRN